MPRVFRGLADAHDKEAEAVKVGAEGRELFARLLAGEHAALGAPELVVDRRRVRLALRKELMHLLDEAGVGALGHGAFVVKRGKDAQALAVDQSQLRLVVGEIDLRHGHALALVLEHAQLDQRVHELALQPLVREVDAELLEGVDLKVLEPEDVEQADEALVLAGGSAGVGALAHARIDRRHDPLEGVDVEALCQRIARLLALACAEGHGIRRAAPGGDRPAGQLGAEGMRADTE